MCAILELDLTALPLQTTADCIEDEIQAISFELLVVQLESDAIINRIQEGVYCV